MLQSISGTVMVMDKAQAAPEDMQAEISKAMRIALKIARNQSLAEDAVQHAFLVTWRRQHKLHNPEAFWPYLLTTMTRYIWKTQKDSQRFTPAQKHAETDGDQFSLSPEQVQQEKELHEALHKHVNKLPEQRRRIVELRLAGLSNKEVAQVLGITESTVRVSYFQAISNLRKKLGAYHG